MTSALSAEPTSSAARALGVRRYPTNATRGRARSRILLAVHGTKLGGAERMALLEAEHLEPNYELLLSAPDGPLLARLASCGEIVRPTATLPLWGASVRRWAGGVLRTARDVIPMALLIRRRKVELVLTNSSVCLAPVLAAKLAGVPVIVHVRDVPKSRLAPLVLALHGRLANTVIVIADGLRSYFRRSRGTRVVLVPDGITMPAAPSGVSSSFGTPLRLCLVGGIDPRKGQDVGVAALAQLRKHGIEATLQLIGRELDGDFADSVRRQAQSLGLSDRVEFVSEVSDIGPYLDRSDIVVAPSRGEWTPLVLMEALAHGKPVVASRVGGIPEVVHDRELGLLVAPDDPAGIASAIAELRARPAEAAAMAQRGRAHVDGGYRVEHTLAGLQTEIDRLLGTAGRVSEELQREPDLSRVVL